MTTAGSTSSARGYAATLIALTLAGAAAIWSLSQPWATAQTSNGFNETTLEISGSALYPVGLACAWIALASVVAVIATSGVVRQVFGVVILFAAAGIGAASLLFLLLGEVVSTTSTPTAEAVSAARTGSWWAVALLAALVIAACGVTTMIFGSRWRRLSARQDGQTRAPASDWEALDQGEDPTLPKG